MGWSNFYYKKKTTTQLSNNNSIKACATQGAHLYPLKQVIAGVDEFCRTKNVT